MGRPIRFAKLDMYKYTLVKAANGLVKDVIIYTDTSYDVAIADISSEITASQGNLYVEGYYLKLVDGVKPYKDDHGVGVIIPVVELRRRVT